MTRMLEHERQRLAEEFMSKVDGFTLDQLQAVRTNYIRAMANGKDPFPEDVQVNFEIAARLTEKLKELNEQERRRDRTPEELRKQEVQRLMREHHVSEKVAGAFWERTMRKDHMPAPDPEAPEPNPSPRERHEEKWRRGQQ